MEKARWEDLNKILIDKEYDYVQDYVFEGNEKIWVTISLILWVFCDFCQFIIY